MTVCWVQVRVGGRAELPERRHVRTVYIRFEEKQVRYIDGEGKGRREATAIASRRSLHARKKGVAHSPEMYDPPFHHHSFTVDASVTPLHAHSLH